MTMSTDPRIDELLEQILNTGQTPEEACADFPELLGEVRARWRRLRLVEAELQAIFPLSPPGDGRLPHVAPAVPVIPGYEVTEILGRGGMGVVYKARHLKLNRTVAIKMLLAGAYAGPHELTRFTRESEAVAALRHEHIVQVYDVGDLDGRSYFTMEFMEGGSLAEQLAGEPQPAAQAAALMVKLARAVQAAHDGGIVHRDLKPANVLLTADGTPKIADFGVARSSETETSLTASDGRVGTPSYMAPEQATGTAGGAGRAADIYSLGAILYEMLTGRPPFHGATSVETLWQAAHHEAVPPIRLVPKVPRDLDTICLKCLDKDPAKRYATAGELADDLERFLRNEPVRARPVGRVEHLHRWVLRHKSLAAALAVVIILLLLLVAGSLISAAYFQRSEHAQRNASAAMGRLANEKSRLASEKERETEKAVHAERREAGLREEAEKQGTELRRNLYFAQMNLAGQAALAPSGIGRVQERLAPWEYDRPDLRNWEWYYLSSLAHRDLLTITQGHPVVQVAWSPDDRKLALAAGNEVKLWDASDGAELVLHPFQHGNAVTAIAWRYDGARLASSSVDGSVKIWDTKAGIETQAFRGHKGGVFCTAWSPDGTRLASGGEDHTVQIWNAETGNVIHVLRGHEQLVSSLAWSPDGKRLASCGHDATARIWDADAGTELLAFRGHANWVNQVAWSPDGARVASCSNDQTTKIWDPRNGSEFQTLRGHCLEVQSIAWNSGGDKLATCGDDQTIKVWHASGGPEQFTLRGHTQPIHSIAWNRAATRLASASSDGTVKIWDANTGSETRSLRGHTQPVNSIAWRFDGSQIASASTDGAAKIWDVTSGRELLTLRHKEGRVLAAAWTADGTRLATSGTDLTVRTWDAAHGVELNALHGHTGGVCAVAWNPDGRRLASAGNDLIVRIWDTAAARELHECHGHEGLVYSIDWSPDGTHLASASADFSVRIWDGATGAQVMKLSGHVAHVNSVAWSPDGHWLASASSDQTVCIWEASTGRAVRILRGHTTRVNAVVWSPDGTRLASTGEDRTVKIWDTATGKEILTLELGTAQGSTVAWSPDGLSLASGGTDSTILIYDAAMGYVASRSRRCLPFLDRRLADNPNPSDWRLRAEINAANNDWIAAGTDLRHYLALVPETHWVTLGCWMVGPYPESLKRSYPPEDNPDPGHPVSAALGSEPPELLNWEPVTLNARGFVDFGLYLHNAEHVSAYALYRVYSPQKHETAILLGSDDQVRVWVNGKLIHECLRERAATPDEDAAPATLEAGWNTILARVVNVTGPHQLYLRLSDLPADLKRAHEESKK